MSKMQTLKRLVSVCISYRKIFCAVTGGVKLYAYPNKQKENIEPCDEIKCNQILEIISTRFHMQRPVFTNRKPKAINCVDAAINRVLRFGYEEWSEILQYHEMDLECGLESIISTVFPLAWDQVDLTIRNGVIFTAYYKGDPINEAIVFVPPCGMPVEAFSVALELLHKKYFVMTWENPFLFRAKTPTGEWSMEEDMLCIKKMMEYFKCSKTHLIGICGGVPIAIVAAAELKEQVISLSSCHGDIYLGADSPMTTYKKQFLGLLQNSLCNEIYAKETYGLLLDPALLFGVSDTLAPYIVYQYCSFALYMKYAKINEVLMTLDVSSYLEKLNCSFLIIASEDDRIVHPEASKRLSKMVRNCVLWMRLHAEHHDVLAGDAKVYERIMTFLDSKKNKQSHSRR